MNKLAAYLLLLVVVGSSSIITVSVYAANYQCQSEGFHVDPTDCGKFIRCVNQSPNGAGHLMAYHFSCPAGKLLLLLNEKLATTATHLANHSPIHTHRTRVRREHQRVQLAKLHWSPTTVPEARCTWSSQSAGAISAAAAKPSISAPTATPSDC